MQTLTVVINAACIVNFNIIGTLPHINTLKIEVCDNGYYAANGSEYMLFSGGILHHLEKLGILRAKFIY